MLIVLAVAIVAMALTNPSPERFRTFSMKELAGRGFDTAYVNKNLVCVRSRNVFFVSKYYYYINDSGVMLQGDYIGVFGFFIPIRVVTANQ
jgi:hypothetical protein